MADSRFDNEKYIDWLKVCMTLLFAKEGLEKLTDRWAKTFHEQLKKRLGDRVCNSCSTYVLKRQWGQYNLRCNNNICDRWLNAMRSYLTTKRTIQWDNSNIGHLPKEPWECLKLFMNYGCEAIKEAKDADLAAILTLYLNNDHFLTLVGGNTAPLKKVKDIRNDIMHSGSLEIEKTDMEEYIDTILKLLQCNQPFLYDNDCKDASEKIKQLKISALEVSKHLKEHEVRSLNARMDAMDLKVNQTHHSYNELKKRVDEQTSLETNLQSEVNNIKTDYGQLNTDIENMKPKIDEMNTFLSKFINTDGIKDVDLTRLKSQTEKLNDIGSDLCAMKVDISNLDQRLQRCEERLDKQDIQFDQHGQMLDKQNKEMDKQGRKIEELDSKLGNKKFKQMTFEERKQEIQIRLLEMYQEHCTDVCISPFRPNTTRLLSKMYVKQTIKAVDRRGKKQQSEVTSTLSRQQPGTEEENTKEFNLQDMFYSDGELCKNIYVTAEAGLGKSTFCKHLVNVWCSAHLKGDTHDLLDDERGVMKAFPLLFYITLNKFRLEKQQPEVDQYATLIQQQWELEYSVKDFLKDRNCLIIADALDESPQDLPYRGKQNKSTILITSRPWKLESLRTVIDGKTIDKQFQIIGLQYKSYSELSTNIISVLANESASQHKESKKSAGFIKEVTEKGLKAFLEVPVLLIQMLILWYEGHAIGNTQAEVYTNIVHHQIDVNECKESKSNATTTESVRNSPLRCSVTDCCCRNYDELLFKVAKLAYETLKDGVMVNNHEQTNVYGLSKENERLCLEMGLLTQEKLFGKFSEMKKEVRFMHKSHHEYFASIHLSTFDQLSQLQTDLNSVITNLDETLKLDKVLMFVAGMNPKMATELAAFILEKCSGDSRIKEYRRKTGYFGHVGLVEQVQNLILAAEEESRKGPKMLKPKFRLDDIYVDYNNESRVLSSLPCLEISHLASIRMHDNDQVDAVMSHVQNTAGLQKVDLYNCTIGSRETAVKLVPQSLCALHLSDANLSHETWKTLSKLKKTKLHVLVLKRLKCASHVSLGAGMCVTFDLPRKSHLEKLCISSCNMSGWSLPGAMPKMKDVHLSFVTIPGAMLSRFLRGLPQTGVRVDLLEVTVHPAGDIGVILDEIRGSCRVERDRVEGRWEGALFVNKFVFTSR